MYIIPENLRISGRWLPAGKYDDDDPKSDLCRKALADFPEIVTYEPDKAKAEPAGKSGAASGKDKKGNDRPEGKGEADSDTGEDDTEGETEKD